MENWYHKLHLDDAVRNYLKSKIVDRRQESANSSSMVKNYLGLILDWVIGIRLVIPIFHTEFDALQLSLKECGEISPNGDFGGFLWLLWLLLALDLYEYLAALPFWNLHTPRNILGYVAHGVRSITSTVWLTRRVASLGIKFVRFSF